MHDDVNFTYSTSVFWRAFYFETSCSIGERFSLGGFAAGLPSALEKIIDRPTLEDVKDRTGMKGSKFRTQTHSFLVGLLTDSKAQRLQVILGLVFNTKSNRVPESNEEYIGSLEAAGLIGWEQRGRLKK